MTDDQFRELNTHRPLILTILDGTTPVDVSEADHVSLTARRCNDQTLLVDHVEMDFVDDGSDGQVQYQFSADELSASAAGIYELQVEVWWTAEESQDIPIDDRFRVADHYGEHA